MDHVNQVFKNKAIIDYCRRLSKNISIPEKEIIFYFKKKYFRSYDFQKNKFDKKIYFFLVIKYFFFQIFFILKKKK